MTCVYEEYDVYIKMLHEQRLQLKVFIVVQYKNCYLVGKINPWWEVNKTLVGGVC